MMLRLHVCLTALTLTVLPVTTAFAAGDATEGRRIAQQWCTSCHVIGPGMRGSDMAPPFVALANNPAKTETYLKGWITNPHPPMPNFNLSRRTVEDLTAYIRSLAAKNGRAVPKK
jgi:mono/diheme cytochrome c family protein